MIRGRSSHSPMAHSICRGPMKRPHLSFRQARQRMSPDSARAYRAGRHRAYRRSATFLATSWNSTPLVPIGALTTSKARRSGPSANLGGVFFAQTRQTDRLLAERIADRRAQDVGSFDLVQRRELAPALAIEQFDLLACVAPAARRPQDIRAQPHRLVAVDIGDQFQRQIVPAEVGQWRAPRAAGAGRAVRLTVRQRGSPARWQARGPVCGS